MLSGELEEGEGFAFSQSPDREKTVRVRNVEELSAYLNHEVMGGRTSG